MYSIIRGGSGFVGFKLISILNKKNCNNLDKKHSLIVKRHPRSLDIIYKGYNIELTDDIPDSDVYIGYYSSLLACLKLMERN